jgi:hypothetical protein
MAVWRQSYCRNHVNPLAARTSFHPAFMPAPAHRPRWIVDADLYPPREEIVPRIDGAKLPCNSKETIQRP